MIKLELSVANEPYIPMNIKHIKIGNCIGFLSTFTHLYTLGILYLILDFGAFSVIAFSTIVRQLTLLDLMVDTS